jgi:hypothetical protein
LKDLRLVLTVVVLAGAVLALVVYSINRLRAGRRKSPLPPPGVAPGAEGSPGEQAAPDLGGAASLFDAPGDSVLSRVLRTGLAVLAVVVAGGFVLILLPQGTVDWMAQAVRSRGPAVPVQEQVAFLYLGDEIKDGEFHLRGVVRNITTLPIEKLDATVRFYSRTGQLMETRSIRMDTELIPPDATAQFHLVYPGYAGQFGSYSVEFVSRQGEVVPYKDMRGTRSRG